MNEESTPTLKTLSQLLDVIRGFDARLVKVERLQLQSFAYVFNSVTNTMNDTKSYVSNLTRDAISASENSVMKVRLLENEIKELKVEIKRLKHPKVHKRKRPFGHFITKYFRYYEIQKLRKQIAIENAIKAEERKKEEEIRQKIEEENRQKNRVNTKKQINSILSSIPKPGSM